MTTLPVRQAAWADVVAFAENRHALRAARRLARALAVGRLPFAPLMLHGPPGTGKSHIAGVLVRNASEANVTARIIPANDLNPHDDDNPFAELHRVDLLVLEDLQHLPTTAADPVCRLLDARYRRRLATVLTANVGPAGLKVLPRRLTSRCAAGLVVSLELPSYLARRKLLTFHAARRGVKLSADAVAFVAERTPGGARPLLGALETIAGAKLAGRLTRARLEQLLADATPFDLKRLVGRVAATFEVSAKEMLGPSRLRGVTHARQVAMYVARTAGALSLEAIGGHFHRDHSTVLHAVRKVGATLKGDAALAGVVKRLMAEV